MIIRATSKIANISGIKHVKFRGIQARLYQVIGTQKLLEPGI
jgi:hypothetical protein